MSLLALAACGSRHVSGGAASTAQPVPLADGKGALVSLSREWCVFVDIRSTPGTRASGWAEMLPPHGGVLVHYDQRGINPVFLPDNKAVDLVWLDNGSVVGAVASAQARGGFVSPPVDATDALVVPPGTMPASLAPGERLAVIFSTKQPAVALAANRGEVPQ